MANISLKIKSDFEQAEKDFKDLASASESTRAQIEKFSKSFKTEQIDKFIEKNKLSSIAVSATSGSLAGMQKEAAGLQRQIQTLISKGMDPNSSSIKKLQAEYTKVNSEIGKSSKSVSGLSTSFQTGVKSVLAYASAYLSLRAVTGVLKSLTVGLSEQGDEIAKTAKKLDVSVEGLQELRYAADMSGVSTESLNSAFEMMNKSIGQAQAGTGRLTTYLKNSNPALLEQVKNATDSEQAFMMLATEIGKTENPMKRAALATAAFGGQGQEIIKLAIEGESGIAALREEAQRYGNIMSGDVALAAEKFNDSQANMKNALSAVALQIGGPLLDPIANAMQAFAEWAADGDKLMNILKMIGSIITIAVPAIAAYVIYTKAAAVATAIMTVAQNGWNVALLASPIGLIIAAIFALIAIGVLLYKNWDVVKLKMSANFEAMKINAQIAWEGIKIGFLYAVQGIIAAIMLINAPFFYVIDQIIKAFNKMTGKEIPLLSSSVKKFSNGFDKTIEESGQKIKQLQAEKARSSAAAEAAQAEALKKTNEASNKRSKNEQDNTKIIIDENEKQKNSVRSKEITYTDMLNNIAISQQAANRTQSEEAAKFFEQRAEMEGTDHATRMEWLAAQHAQIRELDGLNAQERLNTEKGLAAAIAAEEKKMFQTKITFMQESLSTTSSMLTDLQTIFKNAGKESRELAIMLKAVAIAEATVNTFLAFTKALAAFPPPFSYVAAGITLAAGMAKVGAIATTPIPSAQTGGEVVVPDTPTGRNDRTAIMASPGETVKVEPRGSESSGLTEVNISIGEDTLFRVIQRGIDKGKIKVNNRNIGSGVFA